MSAVNKRRIISYDLNPHDYDVIRTCTRIFTCNLLIFKYGCAL